MSDEFPPQQRVPDPAFPTAHVKHRRFSPIWLIPIVAALIALYLTWHDYQQHGPLITVTFKTAQGLVAGQTQVRYKNVALGTLESVHLDKDLSQVTANIRMTAAAKPLLTDNALFWVVKPELNTFNPSDLETLVSGSYIQVEPGAEGGDAQTHFTGLETPPADRSDEAGRIFVLKADSLGAVNIGSPVYFRDINVGQVLGYDIGNGFEPISINVFVRDPYAQYVRGHSRFWNASGLSLALGPNGLHLETHSLRAVLAGGIAFYTPPEGQNEVPADADSIFTLFNTEAEAENSIHLVHVPYVAYFQSSVKDLTPGAPVMIYGLKVGEVTGVSLLFEPEKADPKVRVSFDIQPDLAFGKDRPDAADALRKLAEQGMRVKMESSNLLTGQKMLVLEFSPGAEPVQVAKEGDITVLPATGSADNVMDGLTDVVNKLNNIPFDDIGQNLDHLLKSADKTVSGQDMQQAVHNLSIAMANAAELTRNANTNMTPVLQRLPDISAQLQQAVAHANGLMTGLDAGYGDGSDFQRNSKRVLDQVNDAARSVRLLADYLERHPEALLSGKSDDTKDKKP